MYAKAKNRRFCEIDDFAPKRSHLTYRFSTFTDTLPGVCDIRYPELIAVFITFEVVFAGFRGPSKNRCTQRPKISDFGGFFVENPVLSTSKWGFRRKTPQNRCFLAFACIDFWGTPKTPECVGVQRGTRDAPRDAAEEEAQGKGCQGGRGGREPPPRTPPLDNSASAVNNKQRVS